MHLHPCCLSRAPLDGVQSLYRDGGKRQNLAVNFAGQTASVVQSSYSLSPLDLSSIAAAAGAPTIMGQ
jgi:hypothetical protein